MPTSPSMHESHDDPGRPAQWELDIVLGRIKVLEDELASQRRRLETLCNKPDSNPPGAELKSPTGWRLRAPGWVAIVLAILVIVAAAIRQAATLGGLLK